MDLDPRHRLSDPAVNLQHRSFRGKDLRGVDFSGADLRGCDFTGANLTGANFASVLTGQSDRQRRWAIVLALTGPAILIGMSLGLSILISPWLATIPEALWKGLSGWIVALGWLFKAYFNDRLTKHYPNFCDAMGIMAVAVLFGATGIVALLLFSMFFDSLSHAQGLLIAAFGLINLVAIFLLKKIWQWLSETIQDSFGTSFQTANLTNTNWQNSELGNTNFSGAHLTGLCIAGWSVRSPQRMLTSLRHAHCEYVYLDHDCQQRKPATGHMQPQDWVDVLR